MESKAANQKKKTLRRCEFLGNNPQDGTDICWSLPLKHQEINVKVTNVFAVFDIVQTYFNDTDAPLEVTLKIPTEKDHALGQLTIQIGDIVIEGKIMNKEKATEKYEGAIAGGHTAVMAEESDS